jgi:DNA/RNA-binding domain of Phe-tRNA-synthetase-like protein
MANELRLENQLADRVQVGWFVANGASVQLRSPSLSLAIDGRARTLQAAYPEPSLASEVLAPARRLYWDLGIDPSKRRPASEALLRRAIQGKGLYEVNTAVDAANLASLSYFLPVGLYDRDRIEGDVVLRLGDEEESYPGIGKGDIHLAARPLLADQLGPFGNPSADSLRTSVGEQTRNLLFVLYAPAQIGAHELADHLEESARILHEFTGAIRA